MSLKLYGYWRSSATYRVRIALNLKQLDYDYIPVHLVKNGGEQKSDEYSSINPTQLVPTFIDEDEDIILNQSLAIIEYLNEKYRSGEALLPSCTLDRARVRALAHDIASDIQPVTNLRLLNKIKSDWQADSDYITAWQEYWMTKGLSAIEKKLVTRVGRYAFGYQVSLADVCLIPQVYNAKRFGIDTSLFPLVEKIYTNCNQLESFIAAGPEKQIDAC